MDPIVKELLFAACNNGDVQAIKELLEGKGGADDGQPSFASPNIDLQTKDTSCYNDTPLHVAVSCGHVGLVEYLIEGAHMSVEAIDDHDATPLHLAACRGHLPIVEYLITRSKANVEARDKDQMTPLHWASYHNHLLVVKYLIEQAHAAIDTRGLNLMTPLHLASIQGNVLVIKYLVRKGANLGAQDRYHNTPPDLFKGIGEGGSVGHS